MEWGSVVAAGIGIVLGGVVTLLTTRAQLGIAAEHTYDQTLRDLRLPHFQELFHLTERLPREWRAGAPTRPELLEIRESFHAWYFGEKAGGMFLSEDGRSAYFAVQNALQAAAGRLDDDGSEVSGDDSAVLRRTASDLRHRLSADLGAAEPPRKRRRVPRSTPPPTITG